MLSSESCTLTVEKSMTHDRHPSAARQTAPRVSIVIVSYNTCAETLACLASIEAQTAGLPHEVIVIDNASPDGSAGAIRRKFPNVRLIESRENLGFARANNVAAREAKADYILLLNPDTIILDRAIERLWTFARANPAARIWGSRTLYADGRLDPTGCFGRMTPWRLFCRATSLSSVFSNSVIFHGESYPGWQRDTVREIDIIAGCYLLISHELWDRLGGFDPVFFMYGEEADLCLRAADLGARPLHTPNAPIIHLGGVSEKTRAGKMIKLLAAKVTLVDRYFHPVFRPFGHACLAFWPWSRMAAMSVRAKLSPNAVDAAAAEELSAWREIWAAREKWRHGFPAVVKETARPEPVTPNVTTAQA
jgi:GT2 family glycosyltransferase